ncbi:MAG: hypothetical protein ACJ71J_15085 [Nitrososphaeraceae archaeon]
MKPVPANAGFETITIVASEAARTIATNSNSSFRSIINLGSVNITGHQPK